MNNFLQDLRFGLRLLVKKPGFAAIAVITLALGIGANTAIFSVVNSVLLHPLPYPNSEQLVMVWGKLPGAGLEKLNASPLEFVDYRQRNQAFSSVAVYASMKRNLTGAGEPERLTVTYVSASLFPLLGVQPLRGRAFFEEEDQPGHDQVVILSYGLWQRRFGGDENISDQSVMLDGKSYTVVGVMPADFQFPDSDTEIWKPIAFDSDELSENYRGSHYLDLIARTKPGISLEQAQADVASIAREMQQEHPSQYKESSGWGANVVSLRDEIVGDSRSTLFVLLGAVGFVLLIACANVANLLLVRAATRQRELAIRSALGAGRWRIIRQLLTESLVLAVTGGALGILLALWGRNLLSPLTPVGLPQLAGVGLDVRVIAFTFAISLITGLVFGIIPALQVSKLHLSESLKGVGKATDSRSTHRLRGLLVIGETALALVLLVGAGLMIKSLYRLQQVDPGFSPANVLTMQMSLPQSKYPEPHQQRAFFDQLIKRMETLPDVKSVGLVNFLPFSGSGSRRNISVEGKPENPINVEFRLSTPEYFRALGIELREGRFFDEGDHENSTYVAIVNETFTRIFLPDEDPIGRRIKMGGLDTPFRWLRIVGVVKDVKHRGLDVETRPEMYVPYLQPPLPNWNVQSAFIALRAESDPRRLISFLRGAVQEIDRDQPIHSVSTMEQLIARTTAPRRFNRLLFGIFSALALLLASVGIYGVLSYTVAQRTQEIGIRMALGAQAGDVLSLVLKQGLRLAFAGLAIGIVAALVLTRLMSGLLYGVSATDPATFIIVSVLLTGVALGACFVPARRAAKVDPIVALRYE